MVDALAPHPPFCIGANTFVRHKIESVRPDTVLVAARWSAYDGTRGYASVDEKGLTRTIKWLKSTGVQHIVIIGQYPHWQLAPAAIPLRNFQISIFRRHTHIDKMPERESTYIDAAAFAADEFVKRVAAAEGATIISQETTLCK